MDITDKKYKIVQLLVFTIGVPWIILKIIFWVLGHYRGYKFDFPQWLDLTFDWGTGVVIWFSYLFLTLITHTENLPFFTKRLKDFTTSIGEGITNIEGQLKRLYETSEEVIKNSIKFMERAFILQVDTDLRKKHGSLLLEALQALGFSLRNWAKHIENKKDDEVGINVWLRFMRTNYFEEAFDIGRKELITNGRNFCFVLLATLEAFLKGKHKLHYYAVTPVNPKDWYNWPHGREKPKTYFEEDFIGLFYRTLSEIIKHKDNKDKIKHGRYILTTTDKKQQQFGWDLDEYKKVQLQLKNTWLLPVAIKLNDLKNMDDNILKAFYTYYSWFVSRKDIRTYENNPLIVPLFSKEWDFKSIEDWFSERKAVFEKQDKYYVNFLERDKNELQVVFNLLKDNIYQNGKLLVNHAKEFHLTQLNNSLKIIKKTCIDKKYSDINSKLSGDFITRIINGEPTDFIELTSLIHYYDVLLSEDDLKDIQKELKHLLCSILRLRDCQKLSTLSNPWQVLGNFFAESLHTSPDLCYLVELNKKNMEDWDKNGIKPEFSFFGIEDNGNIDYKLILATEMDYPFEICKIRIIEPSDPQWQRYIDIISKLDRKADYTYQNIIELYK